MIGWDRIRKILEDGRTPDIEDVAAELNKGGNDPIPLICRMHLVELIENLPDYDSDIDDCE